MHIQYFLNYNSFTSDFQNDHNNVQAFDFGAQDKYNGHHHQWEHDKRDDEAVMPNSHG